jgi:uncharacterized protein
MPLHDVHCHFFSDQFFEALGREKYRERPASAQAIAAELGWEASGAPEALADRWIAELDRNNVSRAALIASVPGDEASVSTAIERYPDRFVGFFALNAAASDAPEHAGRMFAQGFRCACLFPAMHHYSLRDAGVVKVFEAAARHGGTIFAHCGYLSIEARVRLGLPSPFDLRFGDPLAVAATAAHFPDVPVIVPHFGAGFFQEALMAAEVCQTIYLDTSSSNAWLRYFPGLSLAEVFRRALTLLGPDRLLFGTDSSFFPRGWRRVVYGAQRTALNEIGVEPEASAKIFGGNFERIFGR